jgi:predicted dehydrogenase
VTGVALLGAGFMARTHAAVLGDRVRVVCARSGADELAASVGADVVADWEEAVAAPGIDVVDVCLPTPLHRPAAVRALELGRHVLLEKPIALTLEDADAIGAAAAGSDRVLMVGHVLRFFPEIAELRRVVASGELGDPVAATAYRLSPPPDWNEWMLDASQSGGTLVDLAIHDLDVVAAVLGPCVRVSAQVTAGGRHVQVLTEHPGGRATIEGSHAMPVSYPFTAGLRVVCSSGVVEHRFVTGAGDEVADSAAVSSLSVHPADGTMRRFEHEPVDPWAVQIGHFLDCVEHGREPADGSFAQARAALAVALAARRSAASGAPEPV